MSRCQVCDAAIDSSSMFCSQECADAYAYDTSDERRIAFMEWVDEEPRDAAEGA